MSLFATNFFVLLFLLLALGLIGFGAAIAFAPAIASAKRESRINHVLIAPLLGMVFIGALALFRIEILVIPLNPKIDLKILLFASAFLSLVFWRRAKIVFLDLRQRLKLVLVVPILFCAFIAAMFQNEGFLTVSGGQDEIQYSLNSTFMYEHLHTGDSFDHPGPRGDHWVADFSTRELPYNQTYRRGAELFQGFVFSSLSILAEQAFPIAASLAVLALLLTLAFVGLEYFALTLPHVVLLQFVFALSFHFLLFHIQGSLAYLCSVSMFLLAISSFAKAMENLGKLERIDFRTTALAGIATAGTFVYYADAAIAILFLPFLVSILMSFFGQGQKTAKLRWAQRVACLIFFLVVTGVFAHQALSTGRADFMGNLEVMMAPMSGQAQTLGQKFEQARVNLLELKNWAPYGPVSGWYSYYSLSADNNSVANLVSESPWLIVLTFFLLGLTGLAGFLRARDSAAASLAVTLVMLCGLSVLSIVNLDALRFIRSSSYSFPYALLGVVLALRMSPEAKWDWSWSFKNLKSIFVPGLAAIILGLFVFYNWQSVAATTAHIQKYNLSTDPIVRHFDPSQVPWQNLRRELLPSKNTPILISGFVNTVFPHMIASGIQPYPHFLGQSITKFWQIHNSARDAICYDQCDGRYTSQLSNEAMRKFLTPPDWTQIIPQYLEASRQAIVPVGGVYPVEWAPWADIWPERRVTIANVCDVVSKADYLVVADSPKMFSERYQDSRGAYRVLRQGGALRVLSKRGSCFDLSLEFDSRTGFERPLIVKAAGEALESLFVPGPQFTRMTTRVDYGQSSTLTLMLQARELKVRRLSWVPIGCDKNR